MVFHYKNLRKEWSNLIFNLIFFLLSLFVVIAFYKSIWLASVFSSIIAIVGLLKWKSPITIFVFIIFGLLGTFSDMIAVAAGVGHYTYFNLVNVPFWLFVLWGNIGALIYQTAIELERLGFHK